jgi:hypothetical protein
MSTFMLTSRVVGGWGQYVCKTLQEVKETQQNMHLRTL